MSLHLDKESPESDRKRFVGTAHSGLHPSAAAVGPEAPPLVQLAMNSSSMDGLLAGKSDPGLGQAPFRGMFDGPTAAQATATDQKTAVAPPAAAPRQAPHNGYSKQDLENLYSDKAGFTAADRQFKEIDFWVNRVAEGEGRFNSAGDLGDGGKLSVGILQWTQASGRLGGLMQAYQAEAQREGKADVFNSTFGGQRQAASQLATLTGDSPGSIPSSSLQAEFAGAGDNDIFKRAQVQRARGDVRTDLEKVNGMVPTSEDGSVSGKQLAAALIMNNIGPGSPDRIFKAVDHEMFAGIKDQRPDVNKELGLSTDAKLAAYQFHHADELKAMSPADREKALGAQRDAAKQSFFAGLSGKYGDVSEKANQQTEAQLAQYEQAHGLDPNNPAQKGDIDKARADIGIQQYADLVSKGPTIGQRVDNTVKQETDAKLGTELATYEKTHAAKLDAMTPTQREHALATERATLAKHVNGEMGVRRSQLERGAVQDNVSEKDYDDHLVTSVPRHLYTGSNYTKFHRGLENRLRTSMGEIDMGHRVEMDQL